MKTKKLNIFLNKRLWVALIAATLVCVAISFSVWAEEKNTETPITTSEYIIFDLSAGSITIDADNYTGYRFKQDGTTKETITGKLTGVTNKKFYVYQSGNNDKGYVSEEGVLIRPKYTANRVRYTNEKNVNESWGDYITNHPNDWGATGDATGEKSGHKSVHAVIKAWEDAIKNTGRSATGNNITFKGDVGTVEMVLDNIWSSYQGRGQDRSTGSIGYNTWNTNCINNKITLRLRGDNRAANIFYATKATKVNDPDFHDTRNRLIFDCYGTEFDATLTVANNYSVDGGQWWNAAIGSSDSLDACFGLVFNGGVIYAGTTAHDDCTAIGGGGNGAATIWINNGTITAVSSTSGSAIGGGIGKSAQGGSADIKISGGNVYAYNFGYGKDYTGRKYPVILSSAIGGGSSYQAKGCDKAIVTIEGGTVYAQSVGGTAIGGGSSTTNDGGNAKVTISGGTVEAKSIEGKLIPSDAPTTVKEISAGAAIGGGTGLNNGGYAELTVEERDNPTKLITGSIGGGKPTNEGGTIGYAKVYIKGGEIQGQIVMEGNGSLFEMTGGTIDNSKKTEDYVFISKDGGAVFMGGKAGDTLKTTISKGTIKNCTAKNGGAIYMTRGTCTISGGTIDNCKATENGGGVYLGGGTFELNYNLSAATISNCSAGNNGGGVYLGAGTMTINGGIITKNTAQNGGGAYVNATNANHGILVTGGEISENTATKGGGLAVNNGYFKMSGGNIHKNTANNLGGAIYVSATTDVEVDIRSGTIQNNKATVSGGALGVEGLDDGVEFTITIGINQAHYEGGERIDCDHDFNVAGDVNPESDTGIYDCPVIKNNTALKTGGGIYITGSENANLKVYCLVEEGNKAADGKCNGFDDPELQNVKCKSDFMMVEGGTVILTTAENPGDADDDDKNGHITIKGSIHVTAGVMTIDGSISNPLIEGNITVDVGNEEDFHDFRANDKNEKEYFRIQYFENYTNESDGITSGQFTVILVKVGDNGEASHKILDALYFHEGSEIGGWWTDKEYTGTQYTVNETYSITGDLKLYAKWIRISYTVYFNPGEGTVHGSMDPQIINRIADGVSSGSLKETQFKRDGYIFDGWSKTLGGGLDYRNQAPITANITTETEVTLYARWTPCTHNSTNTDSGVTVTASFTYAGSENVITRTCSCNGYIQTAALTAPQGARYDGASHPVTLTVSATSVTDQNSPQPWDISDNNISYTGKKIDDEGNEKNEPVADPNTCINAGYYTATLTYDGASASVTFKIDKATQSGPDKPDYKAEKRDVQGEERIYITPITDESLKEKLQYYIKWYNNTGADSSQIQNYSYSTNQGFPLHASFTYYYVYVQYKGDDNHYPSVWVMADAVLFHDGKISITAYTGDGIVITSNELSTEPRELKITVSASDNYHLFDTQYVLTTPNGAAVLEIKASSLSNNSIIYTVSNIPVTVDSQTDYKIDITGAKLKVITTSAITSSEKFGPVSGTEATITRDSAYTAYFEIKNYDAEVYTPPKLSFSTTLPEDTTVILIDRSNGTTYYSYTASGSETQIPLTYFVQMGAAATKFTKPATSLDKPLKYQVVVDFSDCAEWDGTSITTSLTAMLVEGASVKGAPAFPEIPRTTTLTVPQTPSVSAESKGTKIDLTINNYPTASATSSKWNNRVGALVLTTSDDTLPVDARIISAYGGGQTTYYRNANGEFIIPLADFNINTLTLTLISDLFPSTEKKYTFNAELMYSNSLAGKAPSNGATLVQISEIAFTVPPSAEPAIEIVNKSELKPIYVQNASIAVSVNANILPETTQLDLRLFYKDPEKEWIATNLRVAVTDLETTYEIKLGENTGSYYIAFELRDSQDGIIMTDKYYFTVVKNDNPTAN